MIRFLNLTSDCNSVHCIWKFAGRVFTLTENGVANNYKILSILVILVIIFKLALRFLYHRGKHGYMFSAVHKTGYWCLANVSKFIKLFAITWVSTALFPLLVLVSAQIGLIAYWCLVVAEQWVHGSLLPWWLGAVCGLHWKPCQATCRPWVTVGRACFNVSKIFRYPKLRSLAWDRAWHK